MAVASGLSRRQSALAALCSGVRADRAALTMALGFGVCGNLLLFAGPLFMLQIYDRVLPTGSHETLTALSVLAVVLFGAMAGFDMLRQRLFVRIANRAFTPVEARVLDSMIRQGSPDGRGGGGLPPAATSMLAMRDLDALRHLMSSPLGPALADLPFSGVFLVALFVLHPALGWLGLAGALALGGLALVGRRAWQGQAASELQATATADALAATLSATAGPGRGLAAEPGLAQRWAAARATALDSARQSAESQGAVQALTRGLRHGLQAAVLAVAAALVLGGDLTPGSIIAAMVLAGRAFAPVDAVSAQAAALSRACAAARRLGNLTLDPEEAAAGPAMTVPRAGPGTGDGPVPGLAAASSAGPARLHVRGLSFGRGDVTILQPESGVCSALSFDLAPGQALGVIGPSGSGKSALLRLLAGATTPCRGHVWRGAAMGPDPLAAQTCRTGFLPQPPVLAPGTLAQAVAWSDAVPDPARLRAALEAAGALPQVLALPMGKDTPVGPGHPPLQAGLIQRLASARAIYGDPEIVVLDTPEAGLDSAGLDALAELTAAQRRRGAIVVIATHAPRSIAACDLLLALAPGGPVYGPRDAVLRRVVANHAEISATGLARHADPIHVSALPGQRDAA